MNNQNNNSTPHILEFFTTDTAQQLVKKTNIFKNTIINKKNEFDYYKYEVIDPEKDGKEILINEYGFMRLTKPQIKKINKLINKGFNKCLFIPDRDNKGNLEDINLFHSINDFIKEKREEGGSIEKIEKIKSGYKYESEEFKEYLKNKPETKTIYNIFDSESEEDEEKPEQFIKILENTNIYFFKEYDKNFKDLFKFMISFFSQDSILIMEFKKTLDPPPFNNNNELLFILEYEPLPLQLNQRNIYYKNLFLDVEDIQKETFKYYFKNDLKTFNYNEIIKKNNFEKNLSINKILDLNLKNLDCEKIIKKYINYNDKYDHKKEHQEKFNMCLFEINFIKNKLDGEEIQDIFKNIENKQYLKNGFNKMIKKGLLLIFQGYNRKEYYINYDRYLNNYHEFNILKCFKYNNYDLNKNSLLYPTNWEEKDRKKFKSLRNNNNIRRLYYNLPLIKV